MVTKPVRTQIQRLLTLKQQQASITEAREARVSAELTVSQGRAIMAFTIVTIFFVSAQECPHQHISASVMS